MKRKPDPRLAAAERLIGQALALLADMKAGVPAPRRKRKKRRFKPRFDYRSILTALAEGSRPNAPRSERDPRLPSTQCLAGYKRRNPAFARQIEEVLSALPPPERKPSASRPNKMPGEAWNWAEVLDKIRAGAPLGYYSKDRQGLPSFSLIRARRRADPDFDAAVSEILARRTAGRVPAIDRARTLELIRRGAVVRACPPEPGMPSKAHLDRERHGDPAFNQQVRAAMSYAHSQRMKREFAGRPGGRWGLKVKRLIDWEAVALEIEGGASVTNSSANRGSLPSEYLISKERARCPAFNARIALALAGRNGPPAQGAIDREAVLELVRRGARVNVTPPDPGMPSHQRLYRLRRKAPDFDRAIRDAKGEAKRRRANRKALARQGRDAAWSIAQKAVPRLTDEDLRDDVVAELSLLLVSGEVGIHDDLFAAWKRCRAKLNGHQWKQTSLDAPIAGTDHLTRLDMLDDETPHF